MKMCVDTSKAEELSERIRLADVPKNVKEFLLMAATRHYSFNYKYIAEYSEKQGYTLVLRKAATWYVGDIDDITADVVKGLNARYNKVDTKK